MHHIYDPIWMLIYRSTSVYYPCRVLWLPMWSQRQCVMYLDFTNICRPDGRGKWGRGELLLPFLQLRDDQQSGVRGPQALPLQAVPLRRSKGRHPQSPHRAGEQNPFSFRWISAERMDELLSLPATNTPEKNDLRFFPSTDADFLCLSSRYPPDIRRMDYWFCSQVHKAKKLTCNDCGKVFASDSSYIRSLF